MIFRPRNPFKLGMALGLAAVILISVAACGSSTPSNSSSSGGGGTNEISVAFGSDYVMSNQVLAPKWYGDVAKQFEQSHPGVTVKLIPIHGAFNDIVNKMALLYRSPSTAPTIAELPTTNLGQFISAGYLLPLNNYLAATNWWNGYTDAEKAEGTVNGNVYAVNQGENVQELTYNKVMFAKAGIPLPWQPKNWQDIITAARQLKKAQPNVSPVWALGGIASGSFGAFFGGGNLLAGSSTPTVYDESTGKWVADSPGLRETLGFYHTLAVEKLNSPVSVLFDVNATGNITVVLAKGQTAIAIGSNYYGGGWLENKAPSWPQAPKVIGIAPIPTVNGQGTGVASLLGGWDLAVYSGAKDPSLAFQMVDLMQQKKNMLTVANYGGWVPPVVAYTKDPIYTTFGAPFQVEYAKLLPYATGFPSTNAGYPNWAYAFGLATGALIQNPNTTVDQAIQTMKTQLVKSFGANKVETLK